MTKEEFIIQAVLSLNKGSSGYLADRVDHAKYQADKLEKLGVFKKSE